MLRFEIWMNGKYLEQHKSEEDAKLRVRTYERMERYERDVEKYGFPYGMPKYEVRRVEK